MRRNVLIFMFALGFVSMPIFLAGQTHAKEISISADASTVALGQLLLSDDFQDGQMATMWRAYSEDPNNAVVVETNGRLEFRSNSGITDRFAGYVSSGWRLDATKDFALRADAYYDLKTMNSGWVGLGITPDGENPTHRAVEMGIGCANLLPCYWYTQIDVTPVDAGRVSRFVNTGKLYISYTAEDDTLYVSDYGYGAENAWMCFPGLVRDEWDADSIFIYVGGRSEGLQVAPGHAYLDNVLVDDGVVAEAVLKPVYRFWSPILNTHFYTMSESEKDYLLLNLSNAWTYEGTVFYAYPDGSDPAAKPVYRFWSDAYARHFFTISEENKNSLINDYSDIWTYEGIAFYAYPEGKQPAWTTPVYRFWSAPLNAHFYTLDEHEKAYVLGRSDFWAYEGAAWYAVAP